MAAILITTSVGTHAVKLMGVKARVLAAAAQPEDETLNTLFETCPYLKNYTNLQGTVVKLNRILRSRGVPAYVQANLGEEAGRHFLQLRSRRARPAFLDVS